MLISRESQAYLPTVNYKNWCELAPQAKAKDQRVQEQKGQEL